MKQLQFEEAGIFHAAVSELAKAHAALSYGLTSQGFGSHSRALLPTVTATSTWETKRFWFLVGLCSILVALMVMLLIVTRDKQRQNEEGGKLDDEEAPADHHAGGSHSSGASAEDDALTRVMQPSGPFSPGSRFHAAVEQVQLRMSKHIVAEEGVSIYEVDSEELIRDSGISGLCVVDPNAICGVTGAPVWWVVVTSALQCWALQFFVLYWLYQQMKPRYLLHGADEKLPWSIVFVACYTHFVSCTADWPLDFYVLFWIRRRKEPYRWIFVTVFLVDAFMIPMLTLVIGSLYLVNSRDVHETILNCCAVAFISHIDDWILAVSGKMEMIVQRTDYHKKIKVEINRKAIQMLNWWVCLIPVVPTGFTLAMMWMAHMAKL